MPRISLTCAPDDEDPGKCSRAGQSSDATWSGVAQGGARNDLSGFGGLDLIGKAAVLKTAARKRFGVRVPGPPLTVSINELQDPMRELSSRIGGRARLTAPDVQRIR